MQQQKVGLNYLRMLADALNRLASNWFLHGLAYYSLVYLLLPRSEANVAYT